VAWLGPFYAVKITGEYKSRFDQMGLMIRKDHKNWIKTGVEYVNGKINVSAVVTRKWSDWSVIELDKKPNSIWLKILRIEDSIKIMYSLNNQDFQMVRLAYFPQNTPLMVGMTCASPDGDGFHALFEEFEVVNLPDSRRTKWLENNKE